MFKKKTQQQPAVTPKQQGVAFGARVFTMPVQYRHGAEAKLVDPAKASKAKPKEPVKVKAPTPPKPTLPKKTGHENQKKKPRNKLLIAGVIFLLVLLIGGGLTVWLVQPEEETKTPDTTTDQVVNEPEPVVEEPEPEPEEPEEEPDTETPDLFETVVTPGTDSDSDGLSDVEESLVYETNPRLPDTDADGFLDGNEVFHRYNPGGTAPGTLLESGLVQALTYTQDIGGFTLVYPTVWEQTQSEDGEIVLDATTGEGFRLTLEQKGQEQTLINWVESQVAEDEVLISDTTKSGLGLVQSENLLMAYVDLGTTVLIVEYDTGIKTRVDYLQSMKMMLGSIQPL